MEFDTVEEYQTLVQCSADLIAIADEDGVFLHYSPSATRILGYESEDLTGESAFSYIHPHDREEVYELYRGMVDDPEVTTQRAEFRFRTADDDWIWLEAHGSNCTQSSIDGYVINARDISERKTLEQELQHEKRQVQQFVSIIAHDLRNPLTIATAYLDTAVASGNFSLLEVVDEELERMERIVTNTLSTAQVDLVERNADFVAVSSVAKPVWESVSGGRGRLTIVDDVRIEADERQLAWLFSNLFHNAVAYGGDVHVEVGPLAATRENENENGNEPTDTGDIDGFYVADDGPGIPKDRRERVFEAGYTTDPTETGLGLAIVRAVAIAHKWTCRVTESDPRGARFEFSGVETA
ncbi:PAS domain S-box protein [Halomontanus rarus]|uniref:PAS domain S-box protein n=1 Tax=Halomontanus rarus TaxID=3034020 RepID=UPI001A98ED85